MNYLARFLSVVLVLVSLTTLVRYGDKFGPTVKAQLTGSKF